MDNQLINKISLPLQRLSNRYSFAQKEYRGFYSAWNKDYNIVKGENLELFQQFLGIPYNAILKHEGMTQFSEEYTASNLVVIDDTHVNIHQELSTVLFYYLINDLKENIVAFLELLQSQSFASRFVGVYKLEDGKIHVNPTVINQVLAFFDTNIKDFEFVFHLFNSDCKDAIYGDYNGNLVFSITNIQKYLETNEKYFDFSNFKIV